MTIREFFFGNPVNAATVLVAIGLFIGGGIALNGGKGVAGVVLMIAGFVPLMFLEYRHINPES